MTLCITFGKLEKKKGYTHDHGLQDVDVIPCPDLDYDLCSEENTIYPRSPIRDGAYATFPDFVQQYFPDLYRDLGVCGVGLLAPYYEDIQKLPDIPKKPNFIRSTRGNVDLANDADRLKWFKFWSKRAMDLYGPEKAAVKCS